MDPQRKWGSELLLNQFLRRYGLSQPYLLRMVKVGSPIYVFCVGECDNAYHVFFDCDLKLCRLRTKYARFKEILRGQAQLKNIYYKPPPRVHSQHEFYNNKTYNRFVNSQPTNTKINILSLTFNFIFYPKILIILYPFIKIILSPYIEIVLCPFDPPPPSNDMLEESPCL